MRAIIYILLFYSTSLMAQDVVQEGHWKAVQGDSIGRNRTSMHKAQADGYRMYDSNTKEVVYIYPPKRFRMVFTDRDALVEQFRMDTITSESTETSILIYVEINREAFKYVYLRYREPGGPWIETQKSTGDIHSPGRLKPGTRYEYMIYAEDDFGNKINSDLLWVETR